MADMPGDRDLAARAYRSALAASNLDLARQAVAVLRKNDTAPPDAALVELADAAAANNLAAATAAADRLATGPLSFLAPSVRAWIAYARHDHDPTAPVGDTQSNPLAARYAEEQRGLLQIALGKPEEGLATIRGQLEPGRDSLGTLINAARLLIGTDHRDVAQAIVGEDLRALGKGEKPSLSFGVARLYDHLMTDIAGGAPSPLTVVLGRVTLMLDPHDDQARVMLAQTLGTNGGAAVLADVARDGPFGMRADEVRVLLLAQDGDKKGALDAARLLANSKDAGVAAARLYGDQLAAAGRFKEAADAYALAVSRKADGDIWILVLQQGAALDRAGDWAAAKPVLERAVALAPDQPAALNYLGYAQADRGENLGEAEKLLARAHELSPKDSSVTDSLAWAWYRQGKLAQALPLLEQAAKDAPSNSEINDHLGDVYWATGRRFEARYAWRAAAVYAEGQDASRIAAKINDGIVAKP